MPRLHRLALDLIAIALLAGWCDTAPAAALTPGQLCEKRAATALRKCDKSVAKRTHQCVEQLGVTCGTADATIADALDALEEKVLAACPDQATVTAAGYPALLAPAALVDRLQVACGDAAASLAARSFGGPHAAARRGATPTEQDCLDAAYDQGRKLIDDAMRRQSTCVLAAHAGRPCDVAKVNEKIASRQAKTITAIAAKCGALASLIAVDPTAFASRALDQAQCLVATAHGQTAPLALACGPRAAIPVPALATSTQVILDHATYGTRCGDGTDYAFWIRLAPSGQPVNKVVVFMVGGGNCVDGPTCAATPADLFEAVGDTFGNGAGVTSSIQATNPFRDWTKVYLPYCTQDLHTGGGVTNVFPEITVHRYGALNVRASLRYVRDVLWKAMDANDAEGFRPDRLTVLFSGSSAGGGGAAFNYHYVLDDLRWIHTTLMPDSSLGMDNGTGAPALRGQLALQATSPGWNALPYAAPYCLDPACAEIFPVLEVATSARLKAVPEQQILNVDNQNDHVQRAVGQFATVPNYINTLRTKYCANQNTPGVHSFFYDSTPPIHGMINSNPDWNGDAIDGVLLRDWVGNAMASPNSVTDLIGLGTLENDFPGVLPFPCTLP
ncbi:MAG: pectin acetylesterase-family hydrolase [Deltaproteobacteria bacterium]|nr:pectin acetylesterase-family hydrolase [Deltaproteobacteria bacterium]